MSKKHDWRGGQGLQHCGNVACNVRRKSMSERGGAPWRYSADGVTWSPKPIGCAGQHLPDAQEGDGR